MTGPEAQAVVIAAAMGLVGGIISALMAKQSGFRSAAVTEGTTEMARLTGRVTTLETQNDALRGTNAELSAKLSAALNEIENLKREMIEMRAELRVMEKDRDRRSHRGKMDDANTTP